MTQRWWQRGRVRTVGTVLAVMVAASASAQTADGVGVRALGMGGAFVAVADDATAVYWNPAGLPTGDFFSALAEHRRIDGGADRPGAADGSATAILLGLPPLGVGYYRLESPGSGLVTHHIPVTLVQSFGEYLNLGAAIKAVRSRETRVDADLGVMLRFQAFRAGLVVRNLSTPTFPTGPGTEATLDRQVRAGVAIFPRDGLIISADADLTTTSALQGDRRDLSVGAEQRIHERGYVRGGLRLQTVGAVRPAAAVGGSIALTSLLWIDMQASRGGDDAGGSVGVGLRARF